MAIHRFYPLTGFMEMFIQVHSSSPKINLGLIIVLHWNHVKLMGLSPEEMWEFLVEIFSSLEFETQNETWGRREWTHTDPQERVCSSKPSWNAAANSFRRNPHSKKWNENKSKHIPLSQKSDSYCYQKSLFPLWAMPFVKKKRKCIMFCSTKCPYSSSKSMF